MNHRARTISRALLSLALLTPVLAACASGGSRDVEHVEAMAGEHAHDAPTPNAADLAPRQDVVGREVTYGTLEGRPLAGYLARPLNARGELPALVVIHEWWGLNDNVRQAARRLAGEGYTVLAVDLYAGSTATEPARARELMMQAMQRTQAGVENLRAAARYLDAEADADEIGFLGWCFGGGWTLRAALALPEEVDAAVVYYGQPITDRAELARLDAPLLGLFAAEDQGIPLAQVRQMEQVLGELGKDAEIIVYPGVDHAFANPSGGNYDAAAAADAWRRTTAFLAEHLKDDL